MNITEARDMVERYDANQSRIAKLKRALDELKPEFCEAASTVPMLTVKVGAQASTVEIEVPKKLASVILSDELTRLEKSQADIAARLGGVA